MQYCRFFTSKAGLALLHKATGADKQQQQQQRLSGGSKSNTQLPQDDSVQQGISRPFTLVVDNMGTGHVATLQAAIDMATVAAGQRAQQHYGSNSRDELHPAQPADIHSSGEQQAAAPGSFSASDGHGQDSDDSSSSIRSSAAACDNVLIVLLPGTYAGTHALPGTIRHITIAGIPGSRTLLCEAGSGALCSDSRGFLPAQQQQQHRLQELDARMLRLQLAQRQAAAAAAPGQLLRSTSASAAQQSQGQPAACLLSCPFGVEALKLQHLRMELAGAAGKHGAAQCQRVLLRQDSAPASIGAVKGAAAGSSSTKGGWDNAAGGTAVGDREPYCIRLCSGSELRMEWCEFSGGAGGVLSEAGAMVAAMQCSFHQ
ncbi:hypothetical protein COO60DRAFT_1642492 [Scenedesmus sp. NREL 46B-D3]|nr:hypothetical protein COO60DRAFT_1642492 [Scenedesmus sp. NREL 46B-D3]